MLIERVKVVIDTNIIISAFISPFGASAQIFELFLQGYIINYTSEEIIQELERVIYRQKFIGCIETHDKQFMIDNFRSLSLVIVPIAKEKVIKDDPDDDKIVNCALTAGAAIITGDKPLLDLKSFSNVSILSPREFLERLK